MIGDVFVDVWGAPFVDFVKSSLIKVELWSVTENGWAMWSKETIASSKLGDAIPISKRALFLLFAVLYV